MVSPLPSAPSSLLISHTCGRAPLYNRIHTALGVEVLLLCARGSPASPRVCPVALPRLSRNLGSGRSAVHTGPRWARESTTAKRSIAAGGCVRPAASRPPARPRPPNTNIVGDPLPVGQPQLRIPEVGSIAAHDPVRLVLVCVLPLVSLVALVPNMLADVLFPDDVGEDSRADGGHAMRTKFRLCRKKAGILPAKKGCSRRAPCPPRHTRMSSASSHQRSKDTASLQCRVHSEIHGSADGLQNTARPVHLS